MNMKKIYKQIARKHGTSATQVQQEIQAAIDAAYLNPSAAAQRIPRTGETPTPEELIAYLAGK